MRTVERWTGLETRALREALRLSVRDFAAHLGVGTRTVATWESAREAICPRPEMQAALDTALSQVNDDARSRFAARLQTAHHPEDRGPGSQADDGSYWDLAGQGEDGIAVPCRLMDGRVVFVQVPRRTFLLGTVGAAIGSTAPPTRGRFKGNWPRSSPQSDLSPVEWLRQLRVLLIGQDNLAGPGAVLPAVRKYVGLIHHLRQKTDGADRRALLRVQADYAEFAGWLSQDLGDFREAKGWTSRALEWAHAVGDSEMVSYVLARSSQLAGDMTDSMTAIDLGAAAERSAKAHSRLKAVGATQCAYGYALAGNKLAFEQTINNAVTYLVDSENADSPWAPWLDRGYIDVQAGRCHAHLGQYANATAAYQSALDALPVQYRRDRGVYLARQARAQIGTGAVEHAAALGIQAVDIAMSTGSRRIIVELARLDTEFGQWATCRPVSEFKEAVNTVIFRET